MEQFPLMPLQALEVEDQRDPSTVTGQEVSGDGDSHAWRIKDFLWDPTLLVRAAALSPRCVRGGVCGV
jgi:hypothetical protein